MTTQDLVRFLAGDLRAERTREDRDAAPREGRTGTPATRTALALLALLVLVLVARDTLFDATNAAEYATEAGEYKELTLPDGSEVQLNVASRLTVPREFGGGRRVVRLEGEAFFDVRFDPRLPFGVETEELEVVVRGTSFDVSAYDEDDETTVVVAEGAVAVRSARAEVVLDPGYRATLTEAGLQADSVDVSRYVAWRHGRLEFHGAPLEEVARRMERWFGTTVSIADSISDAVRLDAAFESDSAGEAARTIAAALDLAVEVRSDRIIFRPKVD